MILELSQKEAELVQQILARELRELGPEIRHTDARAFRDELKLRFDQIEVLRQRLESAAALV